MEKNRSASFGRYLKTVRLEKGIRLSAISGQTRIHRDTLEALESEDHARLPAEVFVKGFIRAYAKVVGADGDVAVKGYIESRRTLAPDNRMQSDITRPRRSRNARLLVCLVILIAIALAGVLTLRAPDPEQAAAPAVTPPAAGEPAGQPADEKTPPAAPPVPAKPVVPAVPAESAPVPVQAARAPAPAQEAAAEPQSAAGEPSPERAAPVKRQRIQIQVVEDTWLKIIVDSLDTNEYSLTPGDTLELEADKGFSLLIGNATGIRLTFNDNPVRIPGKSGQVVTIQLP